MTTSCHEQPLKHLFYVYPVINEVVVHQNSQKNGML